MISRNRKLTTCVDRPAKCLLSNVSLNAFEENPLYDRLYFQFRKRILKERISRPSLKILKWNGVNPLANEELSWPSLEEIIAEQRVSVDHDKEDLKADSMGKSCVCSKRKRIPNSELRENKLDNRLLWDHRPSRKNAALRAIESFFYWRCLEEDVN